MDDNKQTFEGRLNRVKGSVCGLIVGDCAGAVTEFMSPGEIRKKYGRVTEMLPGSWIKGRKIGESTDDSAMMLCVARSLVATGGIPDYKDMADRLLAWLNAKPKDVGVACRRGLASYRATGRLCNGDEDTLGNGGLLRVPGFALAGRSWQEAMKNVALTHNSSLQYRAIQSYVLAVQAAVRGANNREILSEIRGIGIRRIGVTNNWGDVKNTLSSALNWFNTTDSFEECIVAAINGGHDSDSCAAIAGGLAGAHYGYDAIPKRWLVALDGTTHNEAVELADKLLTLLVR